MNKSIVGNSSRKIQEAMSPQELIEKYCKEPPKGSSKVRQPRENKENKNKILPDISGLESLFNEFGGFHSNGFPKWKLSPKENSFVVIDSNVSSSSLFSYLNYLISTERKTQALNLENTFKDLKGFHSNGFPKGYLSPKENSFVVGNSDVFSYSLFPYLNYLISTERKTQALNLENTFKDLNGFHSNGFPVGYLSPKENSFVVGNSNVPSSSLFSYLNYLISTERKTQALNLENTFKDLKGFHSNGFPKGYLSPKENSFVVGDSDVFSYSLFSYLNYLRNKERIK